MLEEYRFSIKNYDEFGVNEIEIFYTFEIEGIVDGVDYELENVTQNEILDFKENKSKEYKLGLDKQYFEYRLILNFSKSIPKENTNINIVIKTRV